MEREIIGYKINILKLPPNTQDFDEVLEPTLERAISTAFRLWYERFNEPISLPDGVLEDFQFSKVIQFKNNNWVPGGLCWCFIRPVYEHAKV